MKVCLILTVGCLWFFISDIKSIVRTKHVLLVLAILTYVVMALKMFLVEAAVQAAWQQWWLSIVLCCHLSSRWSLRRHHLITIGPGLILEDGDLLYCPAVLPSGYPGTRNQASIEVSQNFPVVLEMWQRR